MFYHLLNCLHCHEHLKRIRKTIAAGLLYGLIMFIIILFVTFVWIGLTNWNIMITTTFKAFLIAITFTYAMTYFQIFVTPFVSQNRFSSIGFVIIWQVRDGWLRLQNIQKGCCELDFLFLSDDKSQELPS